MRLTSLQGHIPVEEQTKPDHKKAAEKYNKWQIWGCKPDQKLVIKSNKLYYKPTQPKRSTDNSQESPYLGQKRLTNRCTP